MKNKFRAFDLETGDMLPSYVAIAVFQNGQVYDTVTQRPINKIKIMMFTGLEDKNGKKIFEDDIVLVEEHYLGDIKAPKQLATVEFSEAEFYLENLENEPKWLESNIANHTLNSRLTVVGNKHESDINQLKKDYSIKS